MRKYCTVLGDMTVLHWAETKEEIDFSVEVWRRMRELGIEADE